ncbi:MAG TPA: hypothetical protein VKB93_25815 [Thermoanaerobaculia bacterium]|nr:hypothetical protein [Thermoanaerobaculia bacterium]
MEVNRWRLATRIAIGIWVLLIVRLYVTDLWDETVGLVYFGGQVSQSLMEKLRFIMVNPLGFWRPIPTIFCVVILHLFTDFEVSFRVLRGFSTLFVLTSLWLLMRSLRAANEPDHPRRDFFVTLAYLFSGSAIITAGWYADIYDAIGLLFVMGGMLLLMRGRDLSAGVVIGIGAFAKESVALALPFLLVLWAAGRISFRQMLRAFIPGFLLTVLYFAIRVQIVPLGSSGDIHAFHASDFVPTLLNLAESFWRQTMVHRDYLGALGLVVMLVALRRPRLIAAFLVFFVATAVVYWGMFVIYREDNLVHYLIFVGRLYLIPITLSLFLLALERKTLAIALLLVPIIAGAYVTYRDFLRMERTYKQIYKIARETKVKPLRVHFPMKPITDNVRGIVIGDIPDAPVAIDMKSGRLVYR